MAKGEHVKVEGFALVITSVTLQTGMVDHSRLHFVFLEVTLFVFPNLFLFFPSPFLKDSAI